MSNENRDAKIFYLMGQMRALLASMHKSLVDGNTETQHYTDAILVIDKILHDLIYKDSDDE